MDANLRRAVEWDCAQLVIQFYCLLDEKRYEELAQLFAEDGAWVRLGVELVGRKAILDALGTREDWRTAHVVSNIWVRALAPDRAETTQYVTLYRQEGWADTAGPAPVIPPIGILRHRDQLVRVGEAWRFQRKTSRAIFVNRQTVTHYDAEQADAGRKRG